MVTFFLVDGPRAGSTHEGSVPPPDYVVIAPEGSFPSSPLRARWVPVQQRERYLRLGEKLIESLRAHGVPVGPYRIYLNVYRALATPEPGFGYFDDLDHFEATGLLPDVEND